LVVGIGLAGCNKSEPPAPAAAPEAPVKARQVIAPMAAGEVHRYQLQEVVTTTVDDAPAAGHVLRLDYVLKAGKVRTDRIDAVLKVERIVVDGKRESYKVKLDSQRAQDLKRVANGVDTEVFFDSVRWFALLGIELPITTNLRGRLHALDLGHQVRRILMGMFPPAPRAKSRTKPLVDAKMSDDMIAEMLMPGTLVLPESGDVVAGRRLEVDGKWDEGDYVAEVAQATLLRATEGGFLEVKTKRFERPTTQPSDVPIPKGPHFTLIDGRRESDLQLDGPSIAFSAGGSQDVRRLKWTGLLNGKDGEHTMVVERTRVWKRLPKAEPHTK